MLDATLAERGLDAFNALVVIVLYKMSPGESAAFRSLAAGISALPDKESQIQVLLYDNTPGACAPSQLPKDVHYEAAGQNVGLAAAYSRALELARSQNYAWLLTLDQDTTLPVDYLPRMRRLAVELQSDDRVAAIVPRLLDGSRLLSPMSVQVWGTRFFPKSFCGIPSGETRALNSASLFRVSALEEMGDFDPRFWLDYVDFNIYRRLHLRRRKVYIASEIEAQHELSVMHRADLKIERFQNVLQAESAFFDLYEGPLRRFFLNVRLLGRLWRQRKRGDSPAIRQLTWRMLKARLSRSRLQRLQEWKNEIDQRLG
jgi:GT2 family glycosyltransferase